MPVFNARRHEERHLHEALASIAAQTYRRFELIVVDDGSVDGSAALVSAFAAAHPELQLRMLLHKENGGQSSARNHGARHAGGEWLAFLDQDDQWQPFRLETVLPALTSAVDLVYTDADTIDDTGAIVLAHIHHDHHLCGVHPRRSLDEVIVRDAYVMPGVMTIRKEFYERIGGFDETLSGYEDDDLFTRAFVAGRLRYLPVSTLRWRIYDSSYSWTARMTQSRLTYWRKLLATYGSSDPRRAYDITLRFFRDFIMHACGERQAGNPLADTDLALAEELRPHLSPVDRFAFGLTRWAWTRTSRPARFACYWFIVGSDRLA
jgi:glycosyltransferase involved in cell wall biosynthesis